MSSWCRYPPFTPARRLLLAGLALGLVACQGGKPGGIYAGTLTSAATGLTSNLTGAVTEDGALQLTNTSTPYQYSGQLAISKSKPTGTGTLRFYDGNGNFVTAGVFKGTLGERTAITGTYTTDTRDSGALNLTYSAQYATPQALATAAGTYKWVSTRNSGASTLTFATDGTLSGVTEYGCDFTGTAAVTNNKYDLFSVTLQPSSNTACGGMASTTLGGLAFFTPAGNGSTAGAILNTAVTNDSYGYFASYVRQ